MQSTLSIAKGAKVADMKSENSLNTNSCLLVIDAQNGFISQRTHYVVPRIKSLLEDVSFDRVMFTRFVNSKNSPYVRFLGWHKAFEGEEIQISSLLRPFAKNIYNKSTYTALTEELRQSLKRHNITTAFVCGIDTDCCVLATAIDLFDLGIRPYVLTYYSASNGGYNSQEAAIAVLNRLIGAEHIVSHQLSKSSALAYQQETRL